MKLLPPKAEVSTAHDQAVGESSVDLIADSITHPLAVAFNKSSSPNYLAAVEAAKHAHKYSEVQLGKSSIHMAVFSADRVQLSRALHLIRYINGLKSTRIFAGGKLLASSFQTEEVINCYLSSLECNDWRAHCHKIVIDAFMEERSTRNAMIDLNIFDSKHNENRYLFPCSYLAGYGGSGLVLQKAYVASPTDQIQALAVKKGCSWCPNFKPGDFKKL
jgi:hypothetical protein